jgi:hypothetical protein
VIQLTVGRASAIQRERRRGRRRQARRPGGGDKNGSDVGHLRRLQNHRDGRLAKHRNAPAAAVHRQMKGPKFLGRRG